MRWPLIVTLAFGISAPAQFEAENDDTSVVDMCENISPYSQRQLAQHIQLNSKDLTKLRNRFEAESRKRDSKASSFDKTLVDLQRQITLLSDQREQDKLRYEAKITKLEKLLSDYKEEFPDMVYSAQRQKHQQLDKLVGSLTTSSFYPSGQISAYREGDTVVVKRFTGDKGHRAIIFGHKGVTKYTTMVRKGFSWTKDFSSLLHTRNMLEMMAGWSVPSKATDSMIWFGYSGWKSAGAASGRKPRNGHPQDNIFHYPGMRYFTTDLKLFYLAGQSMTTTVDYKAKVFTFETDGHSYRRSFSSLNMVPESEEDPQFYPALTLKDIGEVIISNVEFETYN